MIQPTPEQIRAALPRASGAFLRLNGLSDRPTSPNGGRRSLSEIVMAESKPWNPWTPEEDAQLKVMILSGSLTHQQMADKIGRSKAAVDCRANELDKNPSPVYRGMKDMRACVGCGKQFSCLTKSAKKYCGLGCSSVAMTEQLRLRPKKGPRIDKVCANCTDAFQVVPSASAQKYCSQVCAQTSLEVVKKRVTTLNANTDKVGNPNITVRRGWREIEGRRIFFRSSWEANYARYLQFQKEHALIKEWEHEPITFWFETIRRGTRSYLPDFRITLNSGEIEFHEVKGYFDKRSKTKMKRMAKYYPQVTLRIIDGPHMSAIKKTASHLFSGWETPQRIRAKRNSRG